MKILVCISKTPDTTAKIAFTDNNTKFAEAGVQFILNPYDEWYALVRAIELKEADASTVIHLVNVGGADADPITAETDWDQRLLQPPARKGTLKPEYQELKFTLHRKLLDKINLEALATIDNQRVRAEVRQAVISLIDGEPTLLSSLEKQQISDEVLDEVFGLGPLEPLLQDPTITDILVNGTARSTSSAKAARADQRRVSATTSTCCESSTRSCRRSAAAWMNRRPWWTPA